MPITTFDGEPLYRDGRADIDAQDLATRRERYFVPYHAALAAEIGRLRVLHPHVVLYDCHSIRSVIPRLFEDELPHFNLGTNSGANCDPRIADAIALDEALAMIEQACRDKKAISVGLLGNAADIFPEIYKRGVRPDVVTDQTSAHDPLNGYLPKGWTVAEWETKRERDPKAVVSAAKSSMAEHIRAISWRY